jgi:hypothetical protein
MWYIWRYTHYKIHTWHAKPWQRYAGEEKSNQNIFMKRNLAMMLEAQSLVG